VDSGKPPADGYRILAWDWFLFFQNTTDPNPTPLDASAGPGDFVQLGRASMTVLVDTAVPVNSFMRFRSRFSGWGGSSRTAESYPPFPFRSTFTVTVGDCTEPIYMGCLSIDAVSKSSSGHTFGTNCAP